MYIRYFEVHVHFVTCERQFGDKFAELRACKLSEFEAVEASNRNELAIQDGSLKQKRTCDPRWQPLWNPSRIVQHRLQLA